MSYDINKGKFPTYAMVCVRNSVRDFHKLWYKLPVVNLSTVDPDLTFEQFIEHLAESTSIFSDDSDIGVDYIELIEAVEAEIPKDLHFLFRLLLAGHTPHEIYEMFYKRLSDLEFDIDLLHIHILRIFENRGNTDSVYVCR